MTPPRLADWLLSLSAPTRHTAESIKGDLFEEYAARPRAIRGAWYFWHATWISAGFALERFGNLGRDVRYAVRMAVRRPAFTALTVMTLGIGIGATTAIVSVVDRVVLRSLPYPDPEQLVTIWNTYPDWRGHEVLDALWQNIPISYPEYRDLRDGNTSFERVAIYSTGRATLTGRGDPDLVGFGTASSTLFPLLGAQPYLGRTFAPDEEGDGGSRVAVVSHRFWLGRLGAPTDPTTMSITVDGEQYRIIGVLRDGFRVRSAAGLTTETPDVWVPAGLFGEANDRGAHRYEGIARLKPGVLMAQATADAGPLIGAERYPDRMNTRLLARQADETSSARRALFILLSGAGLLMLIAGVNVATLFAAEGSRRHHEFTTRGAIGATTTQLARQLTVESGSIGLLGAAVGVGIAWAGIPLLLSLAPPELGLPAEVPLDVRVLAATTLFGVATGIVFGVVPSLLASRDTTGSSTSARNVAGHRRTARTQRILISVEAALSIVLLVGATLLGRTLFAMQQVDPGFQGDNLTAFSFPISGPQSQPEVVIAFANEILDAVGAIPGVTSVTGANAIPFSGEGGSSSFGIDGRTVPEGAKLPEAHRRNILPGYHETLGIPVVAGRTLRAADRGDNRPVVVVSRSLADRYWPGESPVGQFILRDNRRWEIVGIVGDILHRDLTEERQSTFYFPFYQQPPTRFWLLVRSSLPAANLVPAVRATASRIGPEIAIGEVASLNTLMSRSTAGARYRATLIAAFGVCSLLLAAIGVFGLTARMVTARRRELGIRLALGARSATVTRMVMATEVTAVVVGIGTGLLLAALAVGSLEAFLFGVSAYDLTAFLVPAFGLCAVGIVASYLPARRTGAVNPIETLRVD